jgi:hypothetical protein
MKIISISRPHYASVVSHVTRKLTGRYLDGETRERKAFGVLAGTSDSRGIAVTAVFPLLRNMRTEDRYRQQMDEAVATHAIRSQTPDEQRGWIANPAELMVIEDACDAHGWLLFGNYHTHRVAWDSDPQRDTCTGLDRSLAIGNGQWTFIVSAVDLRRPSMRAFYEGDNAREAILEFAPEQLPTVSVQRGSS